MTTKQTMRMGDADKSDSDSLAAAAAEPPLSRCASVAECVAAAAEADQTKWPSAPRFIILGVQKCGTTTLWDHLAQHPRALRPQKREPHFFDRNWQMCQGREFNFPEKFLCEVELIRKSIAEVDPVLSGEDVAAEAEAETFKVEGSGETVALSRRELQARYLALFQIAELSELSRDKVVGESTPSYLFYGKPVLQRIKTLLPLVRLLVILRNPTDRAYSQYAMSVEKDARRPGRKFTEGKTFEELVQADLDLLAAAGVGEVGRQGEGGGAVDVARLQTDYLDRMPRGHGVHGFVGRGLYAAQLEILFEVFPPEQVLVLTLEQLKGADQTQTTMSSVYNFVGLPPFDILQGDPTPRNTRDYASMADVRTFPHVDKLVAPNFHNGTCWQLAGDQGATEGILRTLQCAAVPNAWAGPRVGLKRRTCGMGHLHGQRDTLFVVISNLKMSSPLSGPKTASG